MSKDKMEDGAKKMVREETEPAKRSDAREQKPEKLGGFRDLFEELRERMAHLEGLREAITGRATAG